MRANYLFTSESVAEGHPDKVCDRISDEIVDLIYREASKTGVDPWTVRIACETLATTNRVVIAGEVRVPDTLLKKDKDGKVLKDAAGHPVINPSKFKSAARRAIRDIGYEQDGFHWKTAKIDVLLHPQSADIAQGVPGKGAVRRAVMVGCAQEPACLVRMVQFGECRQESAIAVRVARRGRWRRGGRGPQHRPATSGEIIQEALWLRCHVGFLEWGIYGIAVWRHIFSAGIPSLRGMATEVI